MTDNSNEVLLGHLKSIREKFGDRAVEDTKTLTALLGVEAPELKDKIDPFVALLKAAPVPTPGTEPRGPAVPSPGVEPKQAAAAVVAPDLQEKTFAPNTVASGVSAAPIKPPGPLRGASRSRRYWVVGLVALVLAIGGGLFVFDESTRSGPSISVGGPVPPRPPTRNAGDRLVDNFDKGPPQQMFSGGLLLGRDGTWEGAVDQNGYRWTGTSGTSFRKTQIHITDRASGEAVPVDSIEADVFVDGASPDSGAGLLFASSDSGAYWFLINKTGNVRIISVAYAPDGTASFGNTQSRSISPAKDGWNRMTVLRMGGTNEFLVNGQSIGSQSDSSIRGVDAGLVAVGAGVFRYRKVVRVLG